MDDKDARKIVHQTVTYLTNNRQRLKYPEYRKEGLPVTSSLIESLIKEFSLRVKGTGPPSGRCPFWDRGSSKTTGVSKAESILPVRAALLSDDDRLSRHIRSRKRCLPKCLFSFNMSIQHCSHIENDCGRRYSWRSL